MAGGDGVIPKSFRSRFWCEEHVPFTNNECPNHLAVLEEICGEKIKELKESWWIETVFCCLQTGCVYFDCGEDIVSLLKRQFGPLNERELKTLLMVFKNSVRLKILCYQLLRILE